MGRNGHTHARVLVCPSKGGAAEQAAECKRIKHSTLPATHDFIPVAIESLVPVNIIGLESLQKFGNLMTEAIGDPRETTYLFQRLSICTQRFNTVTFKGSFDQHLGTRTFNALVQFLRA